MTAFDGEQGLAEPICEICNAAMTLIGRLPRILLRPSVQVFRCFSCNNVVSAEHHVPAVSSRGATFRGV